MGARPAPPCSTGRWPRTSLTRSRIAGWARGPEAFELAQVAAGLPGDPVIVEIGSFLGSSAVLLGGARKLAGNGVVHCVDPLDASGDQHSVPFYEQLTRSLGRSMRAEFDANMTQAGVSEFVCVHEGTAEEIGKAWATPVDMLFLDGDQSPEGARSAFDVWSPFLKPGGIIAVHNSSDRDVFARARRTASCGRREHHRSLVHRRAVHRHHDICTQGVMTFSDKRVLITGGCGFIGSNLARRLVHEGAQVTLIDSLLPTYGGNLVNIADIRDLVWLNIADVRDTHAMTYLLDGQDYLFNLAGQTSHLDSMTDPTADLEINSKAQLAILEAVRIVNPRLRIVFASTRQIYGRPQYLPVDEVHPIEPVDVNGINKWAGESFHLLYSRVYGIPTTCLRLTNTYGPAMRVRDARQTFLGIWLKNLLAGAPIDVFGDGLQLRDFNYVDDVVEALLLAATVEAAVGAVMNLGSNETIGLADLAAMLVEIHGSGEWRLVPFPADRKAIDIGDYYSDFSKARSTLGWQPEVALRQGLRRSIDYYSEHGSAYWEVE